MRGFIGFVAVTSLAGVAAPALSSPYHPFTLDDLLSQEGLGNVRISPDSRWIVLERRASWSAAATYKYAYYTRTLLSRLEIFSSDARALARVLEDPEHASGYASGPFSPSGERMVVFRLSESGWTMGVMTLATGDVRWIDISPELPQWGETVAWRSETQLVVVARGQGSAPVDIGVYAQAATRRADLWRRAENGRSPSSIYTPSGLARDDREREPASRLLRFDLTTGKSLTLFDGAIIDFSMSPDRLTVAALLNGGDIQYPADTVLFTGDAKQVRRLVLADLETGAATEPLPAQDFASHLMSWSPRSDRLLAYARDKGGRFEDGRYWLIPRKGRASAVSLQDASPWLERDSQNIPVPRGGWSAEGPVLQVRTAGGSRAWMALSPGAGRRLIPQTATDEALVRIGGRTYVRKGDRLSAFGPSAHAPDLSGKLVGTGADVDLGARGSQNEDGDRLGAATRLDINGCLSSSTGNRTCLAPVPEGETVLAASPDASFLVTSRRSDKGAAEIRLRSAAGPTRLAAINGFLDKRDWGDVVAVDHRGPRGQALRSWLLSPPRPSSAPPPLVVIVYPGNVYSTVPAKLAPGALDLHINAAILSAAGYAVLVASLPRNPDDPSDLGDLGQQLEGLVKAACATGRCDPSRVALVGHSFGAYAVLQAASQTHAFKAIVASNGNADLSQMLVPRPAYRLARAGVAVGAGWLEGGQAGLGAPLGRDPQRYVDHSPLYVVGRMDTPTLLIESELDGSGFGSLFGALYRLDREAGLVTYYGESHEFVSPANVRDLHSRILAWLARYLGDPDARDARFPVPDPGLENGQNEEPVGGGVPDQLGVP